VYIELCFIDKIVKFYVRFCLSIFLPYASSPNSLLLQIIVCKLVFTVGVDLHMLDDNRLDVLSKRRLKSFHVFLWSLDMIIMDVYNTFSLL
jgi:hypothetical protein